MRAAVDLSPSVPVIANLWNGARDATSESIRAPATNAGVPDGDAPADAAAIVRALVAMTERVFYEASTKGTALDDAARTIATVWDRSLSLT